MRLGRSLSGMVLFGCSLSALAAYPSFDCAKASGEVENLICKDAELASLDRRLAELYAVVLKNTPASAAKRLKAEQRGWINLASAI